MGARAAIRAAGHPAVSAVAGLAPWLPPGEPVGQLAGRRVLVAHGTADRVTSPAETWAYVARAREVTQVAAIEIKDGDHPMLRRASLWHAIAAEFARSALEVPAGNRALESALRADSAGPPRVVLLSALCAPPFGSVDDQPILAAAIRRLTGLVTLIADWADAGSA